MKNIRVISVYAVVLLFYFFETPKEIIAQEQGTWVLNRVLNADNGLPQNSINDLYFDHATGFLWISTEGGLVNYNGVSTKVFDTRNVPDFRTARTWLFSRTAQGELVILDKSLTAARIAGNRVMSGNSTGYQNYNNGNFNFQRMPPFEDTAFSARQKILSEKTGSPVRIETNFISCINDSTTLVFGATKTYIVGRTAFQLPDNLLSGALMNVEPGNNIAILDRKCNGHFIDVDKRVHYSIKNTNPGLVKEDAVIWSDNLNGSHYVLTGKKLYQLQISSTGVTLNLLGDLPELPLNIERIIVHPSHNQVYVGTKYNGLYIYNRSFISTYLFNDKKKYTGKENYTSLSPVSNLLASAMVDSNHVLIGSFPGSSLAKPVLLNLEDSTYDFPLQSGHWPFTYMIDRQRNIYLVQNGRIKRYSFNQHSDHPAYDTQIASDVLYYDSTYDKIWVAQNQRGFIGPLIEDSVQQYAHFDIKNGYLTAIKRTNGILIAFGQTHLYTIDEKNKKFETLYAFDKPCLRDVYIDKDSLVWISTYGAGLYLYDLKSGKVYHPKPDSKEYLLFPHCVADDDHGNFLIPTNNGLFHINRKALIAACMDSTQTVFYHYYDKTNGLFQNEFNGGCYPSYNRMYNGDLLFPSMHGLVRVYTGSISTSHNYPLFIQRIASPVKAYNFSNNMIFEAKERALTWEVNFAQWEHPDASGLSWLLDNDKNWTYLDAGERQIRLTGLDGGKHTLRIRNQFDLYGNKLSTLTIDFYTQKKYYETVWFWIVAGLALITIIYGITTLRNRQLRKQNIKLEKTVHAKTLEIKVKNDDLQNTLQNLNEALEHLEQNSKFQERLIGLLGHDIMTPLQYISKVANQVVVYRDKLKEETKTEALLEIDSTAKQLLYLSESIIHWLKLHEGDFIPKYSGFFIYTLAEELVSLHQNIAADKGNLIKNEIPEDLYCVQEPVIIRVVLHNILLNANKFTTNGTITISAEIKNNNLLLTVSDTGIGMDSQLVADLNNKKPVSSKKGTGNEKGWGLGYRFIIDLLRFVQGKFSVESTKGKGTTVAISVPCVEIPG